MPLPSKLQSQLDDLAMFPDRADRIEALIEIGQEFENPPASEVPRDAEHRVPGCESEVYIAAEPQGAGLKFKFAVDNPQGISAMALAQILDQGLSGAPLAEVAEAPDELVYAIFGRELSMGKSLGLTNMVRIVKAEAGKALRS